MVGLKVGPAEDRIVREGPVHDDPGVFLQDQVQVLEFRDAEAQLGAESLHGGLDMVEMVRLDLTLPGGKYGDFILPVVEIYGLQNTFVQSERLLLSVNHIFGNKSPAHEINHGRTLWLL